ncbi:hypothetical protein P5673_019856 [Acropora cervicornis]|uniref:Uncharacterized protein n=1 Tax=Acropora cervicornis TaxID=6130 RepID=A0AAD9QAS0_ACRCE|nr:hypothetical protein P5673_019856 [Acropora cervicornis]
MYTALWKSLIKIEKFDEALFAAEGGRAQTLTDNLLIQYKLLASLLAATIDLKETVSCLFTELSSPNLFLAIHGLTINIWLLSRGKKCHIINDTIRYCSSRSYDAPQISVTITLSRVTSFRLTIAMDPYVVPFHAGNYALFC